MSDISPASTPAQPSVLVVIVNYKTAELTIDCLHSLVPEIQALPNTQVIVGDNDSGDGSVEKIQGAIATHQWYWATAKPLGRNGGFAWGNNAVIREALAASSPPDYIWLLNPDTVVRPQALQVLLNFLQQHPQAGIAGSRLEDPDGTPQRSAFRFHTIWSELDGSIRLGWITRLLNRWVVAPPIMDATYQTDWLAGASMLVRREVFAVAGLMDETYFMYYEEMDFCLQAHKAGWHCWYVPESRVVHLVGQSSGVTDSKRPPRRLPQYWFDSRRYFFLKNYGWFYTALTDLVWATSFALWRLRRSLQRKPDADPPKYLSDFIRNSVLFRGVS